MAEAARLGDEVFGMTGGEHSGHTKNPHPPMQLTGNISDGCSSNVFINGKPAATVGSNTTEYDGCCGTNRGAVGAGSSSVFINGKPAARVGDKVNVHSGHGIVNSGSGNVYIGG